MTRRLLAAACAAACLVAAPSAQTYPSVEWGGRLHAHARLVPDTDSLPRQAGGPTTFLLRRARLEATVTVMPGLTVVLEPDLGENEAELTDGYAEATLGRGWGVRVGRFKTPGVRESVASSNARWFAERAFPTALTPRRDLGAVALWSRGRAAVEAGVFNGVPDGASERGDVDGRKDVAARADLALGGGVSVGLAASAGSARGGPDGSGLADYATPDDQPLFAFADSVVADGARLRLAPDLAFERGRVALRAEAALARHDVRGPAGEVRLTHRAWQVAASWAAGGRPRVGGTHVDRPVDAGGPGALVVGARVHGLVLDADAPALAEPGADTHRATGFAASAFWMPRRATRVGATVEHIVAAGLASPTVVTLQAEVAF